MLLGIILDLHLISHLFGRFGLVNNGTQVDCLQILCIQLKLQIQTVPKLLDFGLFILLHPCWSKLHKPVKLSFILSNGPTTLLKGLQLP